MAGLLYRVFTGWDRLPRPDQIYCFHNDDLIRPALTKGVSTPLDGFNPRLTRLLEEAMRTGEPPPAQVHQGLVTHLPGTRPLAQPEVKSVAKRLIDIYVCTVLFL